MKLHWFSPWYFPPSCPCLCPGAAPPLQTGCSLGCSPASPASAAALDMLSTLQMDGERASFSLWSQLCGDDHGPGLGPYPHQGHSGANRLSFCCFSCVVHACWNLPPTLSSGKADSWQGASQKHHLPRFVLHISLAFYHRRMSKEK